MADSTKVATAARTISLHWDDFAKAKTDNKTIDRSDLKAVLADKTAPVAVRQSARLFLDSDELFTAACMGSAAEELTSRHFRSFSVSRTAEWDQKLASFKTTPVSTDVVRPDWAATRLLGWLDKAVGEIQDLAQRLEPGHPQQITRKWESPWTSGVEPEHLWRARKDPTATPKLQSAILEAYRLLGKHLFFDNNEGGVEFMRESTTIDATRTTLAEAIQVIRTARQELAQDNR